MVDQTWFRGGVRGQQWYWRILEGRDVLSDHLPIEFDWRMKAKEERTAGMKAGHPGWKVEYFDENRFEEAIIVGLWLPGKPGMRRRSRL